MVQSPTMQEVTVESLERLETLEGRMRISTNAGSSGIVFPREVWKNLLANALTSAVPTPEELEELAPRSTSPFEMPPELWQALSGRLGWQDVHTTVTGR
jgi:hypothetical protein